MVGLWLLLMVLLRRLLVLLRGWLQSGSLELLRQRGLLRHRRRLSQGGHRLRRRARHV